MHLRLSSYSNEHFPVFTFLKQFGFVKLDRVFILYISKSELFTCHLEEVDVTYLANYRIGIKVYSIILRGTRKKSSVEVSHCAVFSR
jgi:hypothetical protein